MHVLVAEYEYSGHHMEFMSYLLAGLADVADRITVAVTPAGLGSANFREYVAPLKGSIQPEPFLRRVAVRANARRAMEVLGEFERAVVEFNPDYVILPSADSATLGTLPRFFSGGPSGLRDVPIEVCLHAGPGGMRDGGLGQRLRAGLLPLAYRLAPWRKIHFLNPLVYQRVRTLGLRTLVGSLPSPVAVAASRSRAESRARLGLPEDGRLLVAAGGLGLRWKGTDRLLSAFRQLRRRPDDRLLLAGQLGRELSVFIDEGFGDLVAAGQLLLVNRFLSDDEIGLAFSAADLVCVPYPRFSRVSGILLRGAAAGRPVIANDHGWSGFVVPRFDLGWHCDVTDDALFLRTLQAALDGCGDYAPSAASRRFVAYHEVANFKANWLQGIAGFAGRSDGGTPVTWEQLLAEVP